MPQTEDKHYVTVTDLIDELVQYDPHMIVCITGTLSTSFDIKVVEDYPLGDTANPKCDYATVLTIN